MNQALNNVSMLKKNTVFEHIQSFLRNHAKRSENTAESYERNIRNFFQVMRNKTIEDLERDDIKVTLSDILDYQTYLVDSGKFKNNTINQAIRSISSLYSFLKANEHDVNPFVFKEVKDLPDDTTNIGFLSPDEGVMLANLALEEVHNGKEKRVMIYFAIETGIRKNKITKVRYCDIKPHEFDKNYYVIEGEGLFDKGKKVSKDIHINLYNMLQEIKGDKSDTDYIFNFSMTSLDEMMRRLCKKLGIDEKRNISFHSLRKVGVSIVDEMTNGDMVAITAQGNWSSPTVAYNSYISKKRKRNIAGEWLHEEHDPEIFDKLTREEMLVLLKSFGNGIGGQLRTKAKEIIQDRA